MCVSTAYMFTSFEHSVHFIFTVYFCASMIGTIGLSCGPGGVDLAPVPPPLPFFVFLGRPSFPKGEFFVSSHTGHFPVLWCFSHVAIVTGFFSFKTEVQ